MSGKGATIFQLFTGTYATVEIFVLEEDAVDLENYLFIPRFEYKKATIDDIIKDISENSEATGIDMACNFCVRDAFYRITGSEILYPTDGENNICHSCSQGDSRPKDGMVNGSGQANDIYNEIKNGDLSSYFDKIDNMDGEDYPNFSQMQKDVNNGQIIIGAYYNSGGSGHVVMMMPERFYVEQDGDKKEINLGDGKIIPRPISLECGGENKRIKPSYYPSSNVGLNYFKWYKYNP